VTLTRKILAALLGVTAVSLSVVVGALYPMMKRHNEQLVAARFEDSLVPTARAIDNLLLDAVRGMYLHVDDRLIRENTPAAMTTRLRNFTYVYPYMRRIYLADPQGMVLFSSDPGDVGRSVLDLSPGLRSSLLDYIANWACAISTPFLYAFIFSTTYFSGTLSFTICVISSWS
jgi:hypothetical protein